MSKTNQIYTFKNNIINNIWTCVRERAVPVISLLLWRVFCMNAPCPTVWHKTRVSTQWDESRALAEVIPHDEMMQQNQLGSVAASVPTGPLPLASCGLERKNAVWKTKKTTKLCFPLRLPRVEGSTANMQHTHLHRPVSLSWKHRVRHGDLRGPFGPVPPRHMSAWTETSAVSLSTVSVSKLLMQWLLHPHTHTHGHAHAAHLYHCDSDRARS